MLGLHNAFLLEGRARLVDPFSSDRWISYNFLGNSPDDMNAFRYHLGYTASIGNEFELSHKLRLFLEARYTRSFGQSGLNPQEKSWFDNFGGIKLKLI